MISAVCPKSLATDYTEATPPAVLHSLAARARSRKRSACCLGSYLYLGPALHASGMPKAALGLGTMHVTVVKNEVSSCYSHWAESRDRRTDQSKYRPSFTEEAKVNFYHSIKEACRNLDQPCRRLPELGHDVETAGLSEIRCGVKPDQFPSCTYVRQSLEYPPKRHHGRSQGACSSVETPTPVFARQDGWVYIRACGSGPGPWFFFLHKLARLASTPIHLLSCLVLSIHPVLSALLYPCPCPCPRSPPLDFESMVSCTPEPCPSP
nr:hypothetical protein CFP56_52207 [Quercus suber]